MPKTITIEPQPIELCPTTDEGLINLLYQLADAEGELVKQCEKCQCLFITNAFYPAENNLCIMCSGERKTTERGYRNRRHREWKQRQKEACCEQ